MFSQILKLIPRLEFERLVKESGAERAAKGLSSWSQFVAMMFCQLGRANSLREIEGGLKSCEGKLAHLGIEAPARASLSYANAHRPWQLYEGVFHQLLGRIRGDVGAAHKFRFKNKLVSLDSTLIDLSLKLFDWAKFNRMKGAMKLHLVLDHDGYLPSFGVITDGDVSDVEVARKLDFAPGTVVVEDRGYTDYALYGRWSEQDVYFVTRMRANACFEVVQQNDLPRDMNILADETIRLTGAHGSRCPHLLRRIEAVREDTGEVLAFLTNHPRLAASTVAAIYKERWQVELLFKALKQNLRLKTFVGTSPNAVKTQIWCALISLLLLRYLQLRSRFGWSLSNLVALLRMNLFTHRDLNAWIDQPFETPPDAAAEPLQMAMAFR
ncbi:MAG TPA: IS4 family transposase [Burkholderiales bacterium]|nr:IS4 family transposase [Burkholderiales bacterium]